MEKPNTYEWLQGIKEDSLNVLKSFYYWYEDAPNYSGDTVVFNSSLSKDAGHFSGYYVKIKWP